MSRPLTPISEPNNAVSRTTETSDRHDTVDIARLLLEQDIDESHHLTSQLEILLDTPTIIENLMAVHHHRRITEALADLDFCKANSTEKLRDEMATLKDTMKIEVEVTIKSRWLN